MVTSRHRPSGKSDRLKQLRTFYYAAQLKSVTRAAEYLEITHATVSNRIRALERELGARLIERSGGSVSRSPAGEVLYRLVEPLVQGVDDLLLNLAEQLEADPSGELRIGASHCVATTMLPSHLRLYRDAYPGVRLHIRRCATEDGAELLLGDEVELLFGPERFLPTGAGREKIDYRPLYIYRLVLATPLDHPLAGRASAAQEDIAPHPVILRRSGMFSTRFGESPAEELGLKSSVVLQFRAWNIIKRYVETGVGVAVLPSVGITDKDRLATVPLAEHIGSRTGGLLVRSDRSLSPVAERFVSLLERRFAHGAPRPSANAASPDTASSTAGSARSRRRSPIG